MYGAPSVKAAWYGPWRLAGTVSRQVFWPVPNVDSVLVGFERDAEPRGDEALRRATFQVVEAPAKGTYSETGQSITFVPRLVPAAGQFTL